MRCVTLGRGHGYCWPVDGSIDAGWLARRSPAAYCRTCVQLPTQEQTKAVTEMLRERSKVR